MEYNINKGIGRTVEYKGLKAQYLFIFAGSDSRFHNLRGDVYVRSAAMVCISFGAVSASILVWYTFHLNGKYGQYGLMKLTSVKYPTLYHQPPSSDTS